MARVSTGSLLTWLVVDAAIGYFRFGVLSGGLWLLLGLAALHLLIHETLARRLRAGHGEIGAPVLFATELGFSTWLIWWSAAMGSTWPGAAAVVLGIVYLLSLALGALVGIRLLFGLWFGRRR